MYVPGLLRPGGMLPILGPRTFALPAVALPPTLAPPVAAWPVTVRVASLLTSYRAFREKRPIKALPYPAFAAGNPDHARP